MEGLNLFKNNKISALELESFRGNNENLNKISFSILFENSFMCYSVKNSVGDDIIVLYILDSPLENSIHFKHCEIFIIVDVTKNSLDSIFDEFFSFIFNKFDHLMVISMGYRYCTEFDYFKNCQIYSKEYILLRRESIFKGIFCREIRKKDLVDIQSLVNETHKEEIESLFTNLEDKSFILERNIHECYKAVFEFISLSKDSEKLQNLVLHFDLKNFNLNDELLIKIYSSAETKINQKKLLLTKIFENFPNSNMILITLQTTSEILPFFDGFLHIEKNEDYETENEMYLFHRNNLSTNIKVLKATLSDEQKICELIANIKGLDGLKTNISNYFSRGRDSDELKLEVYVLYLEDELSGIGVISDLCNIDEIENGFLLNEYINISRIHRDKHGELRDFFLTHSLHNCRRLFLEEIFKLSKRTTLFKRITSVELEKEYSFILEIMFALKKRRPFFHKVDEFHTDEKKYSFEKYNDSLMFFINRSLLSRHKTEVNDRIIVVGASSTGLAILNELVEINNYTYNNLYLITEPGIIDEQNFKQIHDTFGNSVQNVSIDTAKLKYCVKLVQGVLVKIDRDEKWLEMDDGTHLRYDTLILATGLKFNTLNPITKERQEAANFITINSAKDSDRFWELYQDRIVEQGDIVILGWNLVSAKFISELLIHKGYINEKKIIVLKTKENTKNCRQNFNKDLEEIETLVSSQLVKQGVEIVTQDLADFTLDMNDCGLCDSINCTFENGDKITYKSLVLISFSEATVDSNISKACRDVNIVFDGKLVINQRFETNDPDIFAAGPMTKLKKIYYQDQCDHSRQSYSETAKSLVYHLIGRTCEPELYQDELRISKMPLVNSFNGIIPSHKLVLITQPLIHEEYREDLVSIETGRIEANNSNFLRIYLNKKGVIRKIICFSSKDIHQVNILQLFGKNEVLFNNMLQRFEKGLISDLYEYLDQHWASAIFSDDFNTVLYEPKYTTGLSKENMEQETEKDLSCFLRENRNQLPFYDV